MKEQILKACYFRGFTPTKLGEELTGKKGKTAYVNMYNILKGKTIDRKLLLKLCDILEVDPNFIFSKSSKYDKIIN